MSSPVPQGALAPGAEGEATVSRVQAVLGVGKKPLPCVRGSLLALPGTPSYYEERACQ